MPFHFFLFKNAVDWNIDAEPLAEWFGPFDFWTF